MPHLAQRLGTPSTPFLSQPERALDSADLPLRPKLRVTPDEARRAPVIPGSLSAKLMQYGSMEVRWYQPQDVDPQVPHDRDELYVIVSGTAVFVRAEETTQFGDDPALPVLGEERVTVQVGDALFVPAGTEHRFEAMSADFGSWMIFYGPEGGERV
jgi:mannose-6-phosphate isomerase-like protein (cupin superfamily)